MGAWAVLKAVGLGALPCVLASCVVAVSGARAPERIPVSQAPPTAEHLDARAEMLRHMLPAEFTVVVQAPFVLISEGSEAAAYERAQRIAHLRERLAAPLRQRRLATIIDVWAFADTESYRRNVRAYLGDWPRTLHGYYSPKRRAIAVNLASGDDTLMHEVVHPFVQASFPDCPAWFDEGLASLYAGAAAPALPKRRGERDLRRLARALERHTLPPIAALTVSTDREFYLDPRGTNYAQARYLLDFLHSRRLLVPYYRAFRREHAADPTGYKTLLRITSADTPHALQRDWERHVAALGPPG